MKDSNRLSNIAITAIVLTMIDFFHHHYTADLTNKRDQFYWTIMYAIHFL